MSSFGGTVAGGQKVHCQFESINNKKERQSERDGSPAYFKIQNYMSERTDFKTDFMIKVGVREKLAHNKTISYFIPQNFALLRKRALK